MLDVIEDKYKILQSVIEPFSQYFVQEAAHENLTTDECGIRRNINKHFKEAEDSCTDLIYRFNNNIPIREGEVKNCENRLNLFRGVFNGYWEFLDAECLYHTKEWDENWNGVPPEPPDHLKHLKHMKHMKHVRRVASVSC